jgi:hypothetical protein
VGGEGELGPTATAVCRVLNDIFVANNGCASKSDF